MSSKKKKTKLILTLFVLMLSSISFSAKADWRGKWNPEVTTNPDGTSNLYIKCSYSLFTKECNQGEQIVVEIEIE